MCAVSTYAFSFPQGLLLPILTAADGRLQSPHGHEVTSFKGRGDSTESKYTRITF